MYAVSSRFHPDAGPCCAPLCRNNARYRVADDRHTFYVCADHELAYLHGLQSKAWLTDNYQPPTKEPRP
jgi:hypothetical protein